LGFAEDTAGRSRFTGMLLLLSAAATGVAPLRGTRTYHAVIVPSALPGWRASEKGGGASIVHSSDNAPYEPARSWSRPQESLDSLY